MAVHQGLPATHKKRPTRPQNDRRREDHLRDVGALRAQPLVQTGQMSAHFQRHDRRAQRRPHHETAGHVGQFRIGPASSDRGHWLQRHTAFRTRARRIADDLRMHRARPFGPRYNVDGFGRRWREICVRRGGKLIAAFRITKVMSVSIVRESQGLRRDLNRHAAHWIFGSFNGAPSALQRLFLGMTTATSAACGFGGRRGRVVVVGRVLHGVRLLVLHSGGPSHDGRSSPEVRTMVIERLPQNERRPRMFHPFETTKHRRRRKVVRGPPSRVSPTACREPQDPAPPAARPAA